MFEWLNPKPKTDKELQAELRALVSRITVDSVYSFSSMNKYEKLLEEIYKRGLEPEAWLIKPKQKNDN